MESLCNVELYALTESDLSLIPVTISDMSCFSDFNFKNADTTYLAVVHLSTRVDFYKTTSLFEDLRFNNSVNEMMVTINTNANRVVPAIGTPVTGNKTLDFLLASYIHTVAQDNACGKSYQFFRIVFMFDQIYDKPQTCCCGLIGFDNFRLYKMCQPFSEVMKEAIKNTAGATCVAKNHNVFVDLNTGDTIRHHGSKYIPAIGQKR